MGSKGPGHPHLLGCTTGPLTPTPVSEGVPPGSKGLPQGPRHPHLFFFTPLNEGVLRGPGHPHLLVKDLPWRPTGRARVMWSALVQFPLFRPSWFRAQHLAC